MWAKNWEYYFQAVNVFERVKRDKRELTCVHEINTD